MITGMQDREDSVFGYCKRCGDEVYSDDYVYREHLVCKECYTYAESREAVRVFIRAFPDQFSDYLRESILADDEGVFHMLDDYRDWNEEEFGQWAIS